MEDYERKLKEREMDLKLLDMANRNTYMIVTGKKTLEDLLDTGEDQSFVCNPAEKINCETLEGMMEYFVGTEEYEKCAVLRDMINNSGEFPRGDIRNHRVEDHLM
jgi:hypothetical protein